MRKLNFRIRKTKVQISFVVTAQLIRAYCTADQSLRFCFMYATLLHKSKMDLTLLHKVQNFSRVMYDLLQIILILSCLLVNGGCPRPPLTYYEDNKFLLLNPKFQASSHVLLPRLVYVRPVCGPNNLRKTFL